MHTQHLQQWQHNHDFSVIQEHGERRTVQVLLLTAITMVFEIIAGSLFGSMALLADGLHMASHAVALGIAAFAYRYARQHAADPRFSFGTGKINPLSEDLFVDLKLAFKDIDLSPVTPYAGKYVGYTIEKGKLSLDLNYLIDKRKLNSQNDVFLDQLTFGNKVESPDAVKLPVQLAVSLLKNRQGEIDLHLPVSGHLDDPEFRVGRIIVTDKDLSKSLPFSNSFSNYNYIFIFSECLFYILYAFFLWFNRNYFCT